MQTSFSLAQLADPDTRESEKILRTCVHCGFCTATCPTYVLLGDELDSPRGRIYLIKDMLEGGKPANDEVVKHVDRCLSCLSCMTTCPSGVNYMHLVDHARAHIERTYKRSLADRATRSAIAAVLPHRNRFRVALVGAAAARPVAGAIAKVPGFKRIGAMLKLAPRFPHGRSHSEGPGTFPALAEKRGRVAMLSGCVQPVLDPGINEAAIRLLTRVGVEVVIAKGESCCGSLAHHMGKSDQAHETAKRTIDAWIAEMDGEGLDAIIITASGCGTTIKDYGFMFREDAAYAEKAARVSAIAKDITEYLESLKLAPVAAPEPLTVAYHSACSMQHGQQIKTTPKTLLTKAGFTVRDVPEGHLCCGSAGTYNMLQPEISQRLKARKLDNIAKTAPDLVATGNIGCITQLSDGAGVPVIHTVELLDWAYGGPKPARIGA
ncbi:glycolate oxidase subunit GlcF [Kaistia dalseonensis]|uniref:Glycolate oxidase iron-sulfur subunit n=1 Tax=Kaistia dalseonensis TaxID=410840 RepID=A0ABU0H6X4_9HYPH|nr:glycolate oxidase subunit GlcF [Kaistia dalseonensis]MCX5495476.1 glycolate oxidase subunit GlcF [Kaistia dalseonensis]MDQ0438067.1 glycolate oxidase iron-sulfur subunit [Kaistia dalseonensis]